MTQPATFHFGNFDSVWIFSIHGPITLRNEVDKGWKFYSPTNVVKIISIRWGKSMFWEYHFGQIGDYIKKVHQIRHNFSKHPTIGENKHIHERTGVEWIRIKKKSTLFGISFDPAGHFSLVWFWLAMDIFHFKLYIFE